MNKYSHDDALTTSSSALLDHGAEVFTKKMFKHSQSKIQERWSDIEKNQREKKSFTIRSKSHRAVFDRG